MLALHFILRFDPHAVVVRYRLAVDHFVERNAMSQKPIEILLVEDNPNDEELTLYALRKNNITNHVHIVRDGAEALEYLFCTGEYADRQINDPPKVVLLDLKLPKVDGLEVLERVKADARTRTIPVVVLTSSQEERDIVESYHLGVNSYIVKPVDFDQFIDVVHNLGLYWMLLNKTPSHQDLSTPD
jgi:two-component system response regulator